MPSFLSVEAFPSIGEKNSIAVSTSRPHVWCKLRSASTSDVFPEPLLSDATEWHYAFF
jgi:hypothetical protein